MSRSSSSVQVVAMLVGADRVDPDPALRLAVAAFGEQAEQLPRDRLLRRRDAVLQVEDHRVGAAFQRLHHLLVAVRRDEQPAARRWPAVAHAGFFRSSAERVHLHTSSPRWLKLRCSQVTMPALGRDLLSRTSRHSLSLRSVSPTNTGAGKISLS